MGWRGLRGISWGKVDVEVGCLLWTFFGVVFFGLVS